MKLKLSSAAIACLALASPASAEYTTLNIGIDRTASPNEVGIFYNDVWYKLGEFSTSLPYFRISGDAINSGTVLPAYGGTGLSAFQRSGTTNVFGTLSGGFTPNHCLQIDTNGNIVDAGGACSTGGGGGTVASGHTGELGYYAADGTTIGGNTNLIVTDGVLSLGVAGNQGGLKIKGGTSGTVSINPQAAAGTYNFNLPTTAGASGSVLTSAGGASSPMTWTTLGTAATKDTGVSGSTVPLLDGTNIWTGGQTFAAIDTTDSAIIGSSPVASLAPHRVTATGNLVNGSPSISSLSPPASSSWVGWEISGSGIPNCTAGYADSARATIVSVNEGLNTITMACNATSTLVGSTVNIGRDFYSTSNSITTRTIGAESALFGDASTNQNASWMNQFFAGWGGNDPQTTTGITVTPPNGGTTGIIMGSRASTAASYRIFATRAFVVNDDLALDGNYPRSWVHYGVNYALPATDNTASMATFMEAEVYNGWTARDKNPYTTTFGVTGDYQAGCGAGSGGNACSYAFLVFANGAKFLEGLVFASTSLDTSLDGTLGYAVHMASNQALHWSKSSGVEGGSIWADTNGDLKLRAATDRTVKAEGPFELSQYTMTSFPTCDTARKFSLAAATNTALDHTTGVNGYITNIDQTLSFISGIGTGGTAAIFFCDGTNWRLH